MKAMMELGVWLHLRLSALRRNEEGWGAVEWMVIIVFVVGLAYAANIAADDYLTRKIKELG